MTSPYRVIGQRVPRAEAWSRATGAAQFTADLKLPGMLVGRILRSPLPHARILRIDASAAAALPGVKSIITAADTPNLRWGRKYKQEVIFAREKVRYVGEPVAAVAAVDDLIAEEALDLIRVEYEELPAVFDVEEALKPDAPAVHEDLASYVESPKIEKSGNIRAKSVKSWGDVEKGFAEADLIHEARYTTPAVHPGFIEPHAAVAMVDPTGKVTLWASNKAPFAIRGSIAQALELPLTRLRIIAPALGGDFGGKGSVTIEAICCALALKARRPVKIVMTREEELMAAYRRHAASMYLKVGVKRDGTLTAIKGFQALNAGAYALSPNPMADRCIDLVGSYRVPNAYLEGFNVYTNNCPSGNMRAPGAPQGTFAIESALDVLAEKLGIDPLEFRRKNALEPGNPVPGGKAVLGSMAVKQTLSAMEAIASASEPTPGTGRGFASGSWHLRATEIVPAAGAWVKLNDDGTVVLVTGVTENGGGQHGILAQIVADGLGINPADVNVVASDTDATPHDGGTGGSNTTYRAGNTVRHATQDVRDRLLTLAAEALEADRTDLEMEGKQVFVRGARDRGISFSKLAGLAMKSVAGPILGTGASQREECYADPSTLKGLADAPGTGTHMAEVRVDEETGQVELRRYVSCQDVGFAINPMHVEGQIEGATFFGIGYGLTERVIWDRGRTLNLTLTDYKIPTAVDVPPIEAVLVEEASNHGPFGAKGVGEPSVVPAAPTIANAIRRATGVEVRDLPITPEKIHRALKEGSRVKGQG